MIIKSKYKQIPVQVSWLLEQLKSGDIAIPEIQRPFVWDNERVRKLIESLYRGYPVGYLVTSKSTGVRLKKGGKSAGEIMVMDGQQRITAIAAALLGRQVVNSDYSKRNIRIAFNPQTEDFKVLDAAVKRNKAYISDISDIFIKSQIEIAREYSQNNPDIDPLKCMEMLAPLSAIVNREVGVIELSKELDMDDVTEIFNRINSQGVPLKEADFAMSKIAANESYEGNLLYKTIHHFCELVVRPDMYDSIKQYDTEFSGSRFFSKIEWLKNENDDIYDPTYEDMLRVILTFMFQRGKMGDLVQLLSGRNFATRTYEELVIEETYQKLTKGIETFINEKNFKDFVMTVSSSGLCSGKMIRSTGALDFCYSLFLYLRSVNFDYNKTQRIVRRWLIMAMLTGRYSSGAETRYQNDIRMVAERGVEEYLSELERIELSEIFWSEKLVNNLWTSGMGSSSFFVYLAAQCKNNARGFLSKDVAVRDMILEAGDIHHIFPKQYLKDLGLTKVQYHQVANYAEVETTINIKIGKKSPNDYFGYIVNQQCNGGELKYGAINDIDDLKHNMAENCIPEGLETMDVESYKDFCAKRRVLMAEYIKRYYNSL